MQPDTLPTLITTCPVCQGHAIPGCPCDDPTHPIFAGEPGKCNAAPIVFSFELFGSLGVAKALGVKPMATFRARELARHADPRAESLVVEMGRATARMAGRQATSDRIVDAVAAMVGL